MNTELVSVNQVRVNDAFWNPMIKNAVERVIPYQWRVLNDNEPGATPSHAVANFKIAAGMAEGEFKGFQFQDSDLAKWIEAASFSLLYNDSPEVRRELEYIIELIGKAQMPSGYMDTYFILKRPNEKWQDIANGHELYCAGHMLEAAVAYTQVTGDDSFLKIMDRLVTLISETFGKKEGQIDGFPGHEEIELALMKAYRLTGNEKYKSLAEYFILNRGSVQGFRQEEDYKRLVAREKCIDDRYYQAHKPAIEQDTAEGHAVRAMYFFTGMADVAKETCNSVLVDALHKLWKNVTEKRMYITGGVGSQGAGERFTIDYDLPNDTCYAETCAAIGLAMWSLRMLALEPKAEYADIMERALFNNVLSGISQDGEHYFYVNPLMVKPDVAHYRVDHSDVECSRVRWFGCACCPPNVIRTLTGLGQYVYTTSKGRIYQHLYIGTEADFGGTHLSVKSEMPWEGREEISVTSDTEIELALRIPCYAKNFAVKLRGNTLTLENSVAEQGYMIVPASNGDVIDVSFDMEAEIYTANPNVTEDCGKVCVVRGPIVYCAEEADNGKLLQDFSMDPRGEIAVDKSELFGGIITITVTGSRTDQNGSNALYCKYSDVKRHTCKMKLIPYYLWNNRGEGEMTVWMNCAAENQQSDYFTVKERQ